MELVSQMAMKINKHPIQLLLECANETDALNGISYQFKDMHNHLLQFLSPASSRYPRRYRTPTWLIPFLEGMNCCSLE